MALDLTKEQKEQGSRNFAQAAGDLTRTAPAGTTRRSFLKATAAAGAIVPVSAAVYYGYDQWKGGKPLRTAIIGCGDEGGVLIGAHNPEFNQIVAICDARPYNRDRIFTGDSVKKDGKAVWDGKSPRKGLNHIYGDKVAEIQANQFNSVEELLAKKDSLNLEAVIIATPLFTHAPIAIKCMEAGLHVLCEKLMARTIGECKQMITKAKEKGLILSIGHQRHYSMLYAHANEVVQSNILGDIKHIRALWHRNNSWPYAPKAGEPELVPGTQPQLRDGWFPPIYKMDKDGVPPDVLAKLGYDSIEQLVRWRLFNKTGGGLMAELGSHQLDAASIFLGKVKPISVQGVGGKFFYGPGKNDRESDDGVFVTYEFPGAKHPQAMKGGTDTNDVVVVTYSSFNTNGFESYGECLMGSRGSMIVEQEAEVYLFKENEPGKANSGGKGGGVSVTSKDGKAPVMEAASTSAPGGGAAIVKDASGAGAPASRGYREEMEHFAYCVRKQQEQKLPGVELYKKNADGKFANADVLPRCHGEVAMADAILALTANMAMKNGERIKYDMNWFNADSPEVPETKHQKG